MTDFSTIILAQLTDLQARVSKLETSNSALKAEVDRLNSMRIPNYIEPLYTKPLHTNIEGEKAVYCLKHKMEEGLSSPTQWAPHTPKTGRTPSAPNAPVKGRIERPKVSIPYPTMGMADVLAKDETVNFEIKTKNGDAIAVCNFDGTDLTVTECEKVSSIVGLKSSKPGDILYKFRDSLVELDLCSKFECPPWRRCFVTRDGVKKSLEELRKA